MFSELYLKMSFNYFKFYNFICGQLNFDQFHIFFWGGGGGNNVLPDLAK